MEMKGGKRRDLTKREWLLLDAMEYRYQATTEKGNMVYINNAFALEKAEHIEAVLGMRLVRLAFWISEKIG